MNEQTLNNSMIHKEVVRLERVDNMLFGNKRHENFVLVTDEENVASYIKGKTGESAHVVPISTDLVNYNLWIVHTSKECFHIDNKQMKWISDKYNWDKFVSMS